MIAALNKHFRPITETEFFDEWDLPSTQNAIEVSQFPENVSKWIFEEIEDKSEQISRAYLEYINALTEETLDSDKIERTRKQYYKANSDEPEKKSGGFAIVTD